MKIGFLKDSEPRVSITPSTLEKYIALNHDIFIEKNAGIQSGFSDYDYVNAELSSRNNIYNKCDIIVSVNSSSIVSFSEVGFHIHLLERDWTPSPPLQKIIRYSTTEYNIVHVN